MPWKPQYDGDFPTLGWGVVDWIENYLQRPDAADYVPFRLYQEQIEFIAELYRIDPSTGRRKYHRAVLSRPRGWGKSPLAAALCAAEGLAPVLFDGWDADGQPVGKPWSEVRTPLVNIAAVAEEQTMNTYSSLLEMLEAPQLYDDYPGLEPMGSFVNLPRGMIKTITSSSSTVKGARAVFAVADQTEVWYQSNGGVRLIETMRSNAAKLGGTTLETPNAFIPGEGSVAEHSASDAAKMLAGETLESSLLWDHREAPASTELSDRDSLYAGLRFSYGDAAQCEAGCSIHLPACPSGHVDLERLMTEIWDPSKDPQVSRSDFLNQITHASDSWMTSPEMKAIIDRDKKIQPGDMIVLGFDGSRGRVRGNADATALVGMRVSDRHLFEIAVWQRTAQDGVDWKPNPLEVDAVIDECFSKYTVVAFYADPSGWSPQVAEWEARYGRKLRVKASRSEPIAAWPRGKDTRVSEHLVKMREAIVNKEITFCGSPRLLSHFLNARRRRTKRGYLLYKAYPDSPDKIDAAYAAVMAYKACLDVTSEGIGVKKKRPRRKVIMA